MVLATCHCAFAHQSMPGLKNSLRATSHQESVRWLADVVEQLQSAGYDCSEISLVGEGSESSVYAIVDPQGEDCVLKISQPLAHGWEPDWGNREFDALIYEVDGDAIHELEGGVFWFVQEGATIYDRADEIPDYLWDDFMEQLNRSTENLFVDDSGLVKQLGVVDREDGERLVVVDYSAFSATEMNLY